MYGIVPPQIDQLQLATGQVPGFNYPIPVVRIVFEAQVFFDFNKDTVRPEALPVLNVIAENMRRDVPDANLLILGHTDAIGSDDYNIDLSRRRALNVMQGLISRGVRPLELATVAIGKSQPIAPNSTEEGRARNRRVEFMISASTEANLKLVEHRLIIQDYLKVSQSDSEPAPVSSHVEVFKPVETQPIIPVLQPVETAQPTIPEPKVPSLDTSASRPTEPVLSQQPTPVAAVQLRSFGDIELQKPVPLAEVQIRTPTTPEERPLSDYVF